MSYKQTVRTHLNCVHDVVVERQLAIQHCLQVGADLAQAGGQAAQAGLQGERQATETTSVKSG